MSHTAILTTQANPVRPHTTYKVTFDTQEQLEAWAFNTVLRLNQNERWTQGDQKRPANTVITVWAETTTPTLVAGYSTREYELSWGEVLQLLATADNVPSGENRQGRPNKRVLQAMTTRDRREGARASGY
jgi:hypothetical protein